MYLNIINPTGHIYSVDLTIPLWRIELAQWGTDLGAPQTKPWLGLILRYVTGVVPGEGGGKTVTQVVQIVGVDTGTAGDELVAIVAKGFPHADRAENRRMLKEAVGILHNAVEKSSDADVLVERLVKLVDIRHDLLDGLWGKRPDTLGSLGPIAEGALDGYRFALVQERFDKWLANGGPSMGDGSGVVVVPPGGPGMGTLKGKAKPTPAPKNEPETLTLP